MPLYARLVFLAVLVLIPSSVFSLQITEIMYDPDGSDSGREWIELYNNESDINLTGLQLGTDGSNHKLNLSETNEILVAGAYAVIAQNIDLFLADYPQLFGVVIDSSWTGLTNSANHTILIKNTPAIFDNITYEPVAVEGKSVCRNVSFYECNPTPGLPNIAVQENNQTNQTNETTVCSITIETDSLVYSDTIAYDIHANVSAEIEYWIEDLFGNIVRSHVKSNTTETRHWSPPNTEGSEAYTIFANASCGNASKTIIVKGSAPQTSSFITIDDADTEISFGESADVDLSVYRGDTDKYSVKIYVSSGDKKLSAESTFHASSKMKLYKVQIPVQLKTNCDGDYTDGTYDIVAEGLDIKVIRQISVKGTSSSNCKTITVSSGSSGGNSGSGVATKKEDSRYSVVYPETVFVGSEFETTVKINATEKKTLSVYSYVYKGNTPVSEGFDGSSWKGSWTANKQEIVVEPGGNYSVTLRSRIEDDTSPGLYNLRVKISGEEITKEIEVREKVKEMPAKAVINTSVTNVTTNRTAGLLPITGFAAQKERKLDKHIALLQLFSVLEARLFKH